MSEKIDKISPDSEIIKNLEAFGLNETESRIYTALLQTGGGSVNGIAQIAGIKRTTAYSTLDGLIKQGLARYDEFGLKRKIVPEDPERLQGILREKQAKLTKTLPVLESLFNLRGNESFIKYYKGLKAIKPLYEQLIRDIRPHEEYFVISNQQMWLEHDPAFFEDFSFRRGKLPIDVKMIFEDNEGSRKYFANRARYNAKIKFFPEKVKLQTNMVITPQRTLTHQIIHPIVALVTENKSFISLHQNIFRLLWDSLPDAVDENKSV